MLDGDYSPSESDDKQSSAASHVDLELVVKAISEFLDADYSAKYSVSGFIQYNAEKYAPSSSMDEKQQSRSDKKHFDKRKGFCGKRFSQAVFGFEKSLIPSAKLHKGRGQRKSGSIGGHLLPLFAITTGWAGEDERTCILRANGLMKPPDVLKSLVENLMEDNGKEIHLDPEDKKGFSESIKFLGGLVKTAVDFMEAEEIKLTTTIGACPTTVEVRGRAAARLKREVVDRYWGPGAIGGVCFGGCCKQMVYQEVQLAHWRLKGELTEANGFVADTAQVIWLLPHIVLFHSKCPFLHCATLLAVFTLTVFVAKTENLITLALFILILLSAENGGGHVAFLRELQYGVIQPNPSLFSHRYGKPEPAHLGEVREGLASGREIV